MDLAARRLDPAALLKRARYAANMTQAEVAAVAGVSQPMISAYEKGHRSPSIETLEKLLAGCGLQLTVDLEPLGADLDARVRAALTTPAADRSGAIGCVLPFLLRVFEGVPYAIGGLAAAALHGAPVSVDVLDFLLLDDDTVLATVGPRMRAGFYKVWIPEDERFFYVSATERVLRELNPSRWLHPFGEFRITLVPAERIDRCGPVPWEETSVPAERLWDIEVSDPGVAAVLARTRELLATTGPS